jgi:hypothetical protein
LVKEWVQRGHQVTVLTGVPNYPLGSVFEDYRLKPSAFAEYEGAKVIRVPMLSRGHGDFRLVLNYLSFVVGASPHPKSNGIKMLGIERPAQM